MKTMKQVMGALSRDMLFLHGHIVSVRGLDGAAQRSTYPAQKEDSHSRDAKASVTPPRRQKTGVV